MAPSQAAPSPRPSALRRTENKPKALQGVAKRAEESRGGGEELINRISSLHHGVSERIKRIGVVVVVVVVVEVVEVVVAVVVSILLQLLT